MLIDTHCHLHFDAFDLDREEVIHRAREAGVRYLVNVGTDPLSNEASLRLAQTHPFIFHTVGLHPHHSHEVTDADLKKIRIFVQENKPYAIGEIGLDYFKSEAEASTQKKIFTFMLDLAMECQLPVIVHSRNAFKDTLELIRSQTKGQIAGVMHCFSYDADSLKELLDIGFLASFTANLTFKNAGALLEVAKQVPLDRLMLETDSPYLAPQAFRGKRNEPAHLAQLALFLARGKNMDLEVLEKATTQNAINFFKLPLESAEDKK